MFGWTDCICFRQGHWLQSVKCYLYVSPTTYWSGESHLAIWSPETACQTAVISWCSGQNFRSLSVEASKMKPFLYVCLLRRSATVVDWNWQYSVFTFMNAVYDSYDWRTVDSGQKEGRKSQLGLRDWCSLQKLI